MFPSHDQAGVWEHVMWVRPNDLSQPLCWVNGVAQSISGAAVQLTNNLPTVSENIYIGKRGQVTDYYNGKLDQLAVWDSDQSANIATIYGGGSPGDITALSPDFWLQMNTTDVLNVASGVVDTAQGNNISGVNMDATNIDNVNYP